ncbi:rhomboid-like protein [Streptomyces sp. SID486]|uniref:rhomboid-like protein n=1 Tax=Streptomyces sp. SID486 TaxID=2690264 RepID=UPI0031F72265
MDRITPGPATDASPPPSGTPLPDGTPTAPPRTGPPEGPPTAPARTGPADGTAAVPPHAGLLDGMPRQRGTATTPEPDPALAPATDPALAPGRNPGLVADRASAPGSGPVLDPAPAPDPARLADRDAGRAPGPGRPLRSPLAVARSLWRLLPTPAGTPFTFGYAAVLAVTSLVAAQADPAVVYALHQGSSTDVAHLVGAPVPVLLASALWIAGGVLSPYALAFVLALTALERRTGGVRAAGVFLAGHVLATLATEVPVGLAVLFGHLPPTSLHRLDYGISFGVATSVGALAGLLTPWLRWPLLALTGGLLLNALIAFQDPMTDWGHLIALAIGVTGWPLLRRGRRTAPALPAPSPLPRPARANTASRAHTA